MKFTYPAVIGKTEEGGYRAAVPDLACCEASGDSLEDVLDNIYEAVYDWIYLELSEDDGVLPPISDESDLELGEGEFVRDICVNIRFTDGWDE